MADEKTVENAFGDDDIGGRKFFADNLLKMFAVTQTHLTVALDASWGMGKTWFLERFKKHCEQSTNNIDIVLFNAWEHDHGEEPFAPLFSEIFTALKIEEVSFSKDRILTDAGTIIRHISYNSAKKASMGLFDLKELEAEAEQNRSMARQIIDNHQALTLAIHDFKTALNKRAKQFPNKRLIIIIDELDRCRPVYAVNMLERIKHIFGIDGVHFLMGIDTDQLGNTIKGLYGQNYDGIRYLDRLFDYQLKLPESSCNGLALSYIQQIIDDANNRPRHPSDVLLMQLHEWFYKSETFDNMRDLNARSVKRIIDRLIITIKIKQVREIEDFELLFFFCYLANIYPKIYKQLTADVSAMLEAFRIFGGSLNNRPKYNGLLIRIAARLLAYSPIRSEEFINYQFTYLKTDEMKKVVRNAVDLRNRRDPVSRDMAETIDLLKMFG
ncbi:KAP family P-loop NTPase fold protein [Rubellicoccus peritrichatus]|uniref:P-loop NTPase fold protein n=1 Tax=Rubellicoccus peritrichatus TaxID=3080537 RepID=A0AAQ3LJ64_9BACT|nr:P-loop NTPase fold protein [Puniceicoccus sp. CR14]WOO43144.1 P-loop NTPase fold protein [Puniceicoccus sp. CR14]